MIDDDRADPKKVKRIVLCSGKVSHEARARRDQRIEAGAKGCDEVAVVRIEQLYPWPSEAIEAVISRYKKAEELVWLQEEPENMGAWPFAHHQFHREIRDRLKLSHVARAESATPATGSSLVHQAEVEDLMTRAIGTL